MPMEMLSYLDVNGNLSTNCQHTIPDDQLVRGYEVMLMTRHIDDRMITLQRQGAISFAMSSYGEEGCVVASAAALKLQDWLYPQYREDGIMFWRGATAQQYIHHMFCNGKDPILGRQMPNHFGSRELNIVTVSSPLATKIPHAAGCAYAMKLQKEDAIAVSYFGEGTTSKGDFHVGLNFAALRHAPVIFFCRNNGYAISTKTSNQYAAFDVASKGLAYGITSYKVDGNDYFAVHETVTKARQQCLDGAGPILIEAVTYRLGAHSTSDDPSAYREDVEVEEWKGRDPVLRLSRYLRKKGLWDDEKERAFLDKIKGEVDEAIKVAKDTPPPPLSSIIEDVYFEVPPKLQREYDELKTFFPETT
ncbi:MAG: thiamine pyrophosphate-dependent enzyme [Chlamydiales bacterium]|nr:thiamine pyrophosphate-dependent enzyme [Chlamydiales bacterium]